MSEAGFPLGGTPRSKLAFSLKYAMYVLSNGNWQPWRFRVTDSAVELFADYEQTSVRIDPECRELVISCGAALYHLKLALSHFGCLGRVELFPSLDQPDLFARVHYGARGHREEQDSGLFRVISRRQTTREVSEARPIPDTVVDELKTAAVQEKTWLELVQSELGRRRLVDFTVESERRQSAIHIQIRDHSSWLGVPAASLGFGRISGSTGPLLTWVVRAFDLGKFFKEQYRKPDTDASVLAVLKTKTDGNAAWLAAGQALARVLLTAQAAGVSVSFLNQAVQCQATRARLRTEIGRKGFPQMILRLGYIQSELRPPSTLSRPVFQMAR